MAVIECCGMAKRNLSFCAMILVIIGGILVVLSTVVMWGVTDALREDLVRRSIIDSEDDSAFAAWTNGSLATPEYQHSTFYNLTNAEEVMKGGRPHFEEVGPYTYFLVLSKTNVSFSEDKKTAQYTLNTDYLFVPEMSNGTEADIIIGLNVAYLAVLAGTGGESTLEIAWASATLQNWTAFYTGKMFLDYVAAMNSPLKLQIEQSKLTEDNDEDGFLSTWANATETPSEDWIGMIISSGQDGASNISLSSSQMLFDESAALSLTNITEEAYLSWLEACASPSSPWFPTLAHQFALNDAQMSMICKWHQGSFQTVHVDPYMLNKYKVDERPDIGYLQWGECSVLGNHVSASQVFMDYDFGGFNSPEFGCFEQNLIPKPSLTWQEAKEYLVGECGITNMTCYGYWLLHPTNSEFGLPSKQVVNMQSYMNTVDEKVSIANLRYQYYENNGGMFVSHTAREWLIGYTDPIVAYADPEDDFICYQCVTSETYRIYTGHGNASAVRWVYEWEGSETVPYNYQSSHPVQGTNADGQFQAGLTSQIPLKAFSATYGREIPIVYTKTIREFYDIPMWRYVIADSTFAVDPDRYQFIQGFTNMSESASGAPLFYSNPHFYQCHEWAYWTSFLDNVRGPDASTEDMTKVDIDQWSGAVMHIDLSVQLNTFLDPSLDWFNRFSKDVGVGYIFPSVWVSQTAILSAEDAKSWKVDVQGALDARIGISVTLLAVGLIMVGVGIALYIVDVRGDSSLDRRRSREYYSPLDE